MVNILPSPQLIMIDVPSHLTPLPFSFDDTHHRLSRDTSQILTKLLKSLIYSTTTPLPFESYPEDIYSIPLIREHHDSYLHYIDTHSLVETPDEPSFFTFAFTSPINPNDTFRKKHVSF